MATLLSMKLTDAKDESNVVKDLIVKQEANVDDIEDESGSEYESEYELDPGDIPFYHLLIYIGLDTINKLCKLNKIKLDERLELDCLSDEEKYELLDYIKTNYKGKHNRERNAVDYDDILLPTDPKYKEKVEIMEKEQGKIAERAATKEESKLTECNDPYIPYQNLLVMSGFNTLDKVCQVTKDILDKIPAFDHLTDKHKAGLLDWVEFYYKGASNRRFIGRLYGEDCYDRILEIDVELEETKKQLIQEAIMTDYVSESEEEEEQDEDDSDV